MDGYSQNDSDPLPGHDALTDQKMIGIDSFADALDQTIAFVSKTFSREIEQQRLYYHGWGHVHGVARRARLIFDTVVSCDDISSDNNIEQSSASAVSPDLERQRDLLQLCAIAHDMLQIFSPQLSPHTSRQRQSGRSEKATVDALVDFIEQLNQSVVSSASTASVSNVRFSTADIAIIREAIEATVCQYDPTDGSIYQPLLYPQHQDKASISLVARCLALADIGTLGIEGIDAYTHEASLLLLEENLDIVDFLGSESSFDNMFKENLRFRLLQRAQFEVSFAKGRLARLDAELQGLSTRAIATLKRDVFKHLTPATIRRLETITPTAEGTTLSELLDYFQLRSIV